MNTTRIVVLTNAVGAGGVAAYLASGSDSRPPPEAVAQLQTVEVLVAKADIGLGQNSVVGKTATLNQVDISPNDGARRGNINAGRYGIANPTTIQT